MRLGIIPARGGSKRIPRKNIRAFAGKPMISWSIDALRQSGVVDRIIVSTDDEEIAEISRAYGAEVPFLRPASLADDHTGTTAVVKHAVDWLVRSGDDVAEVCCLYATAPFVTGEDVQRGLACLSETAASYAFTVTTFAFPIQRALRLDSDGRIGMFYPEHADTRSQDLEEAYHDAGQFYWAHRDVWLTEKPIYTPQSVPVMMPRARVQDIDTPEDWERAALMFKALRQDGES